MPITVINLSNQMNLLEVELMRYYASKDKVKEIRNAYTLRGNEKNPCYTGAEFEALSENSKKDIFAKREGKVFCRVEPRHKRELVKILIELVRRFVSIMIFLG